ncbi:endonuclease G [Flavobacterium sp. 5]|nr:endonuclease G [Flavobacterium sp. 5]
MISYTQIISKYLLIPFCLISCKDYKKEKMLSDKAFVSISEKEQSNLLSHSFQKGTFDYLPTSTTNQIIKHLYYTLSYNEDKEQAEWVAYELNGSNDKKNKFERPFFIKDPKVTSGSADWKNYKKSGYDKGHLCPAGDMTFDKKAYDETFYTSNIAPQLHDFNDGVWNKLEQKTRYWSVKYKKLYVITGGILSSNLKTIGKENVAVPNYFYKIIGSDLGGKFKMIAFLVPNAKSDKPLYDFVVSVDTIEKMTGIDFFSKLEDKIETNLEKKNDYKEWSFN